MRAREASAERSPAPPVAVAVPLRAEDFQPDYFPDVEGPAPDVYPDMPAASAAQAAPPPGHGDVDEREPAPAPPVADAHRPAEAEPWQPPQWQYSTKRARVNQRQQKFP